MRRKVAVVACLLLASAVWAEAPVQARDQGHRGTLSPSNTLIEAEFLPLAGIYPIPEGAAYPFSTFRPAACRQVTYCDTHAFTLTLPEGYREFYKVEITLEWPENTIPERNRVTLHLWPDDDPVLGAPWGPCSSPRDQEPEPTEEDPDSAADYPCRKDATSYSFAMFEPEPTRPECLDLDRETDDQGQECLRYLITVVNADGVNLGYTIRLTFTELDLDFGDFPDPELEFAATPQREGPIGRPTLEDLFANPEAVENKERPRILVPGPDGEMTELEVPVLAAGQREADTGRSVNPFVTAGVLIPLLGALAFFLLRRRRDAAGP